jgi:hypothetical protein
MSRFPEDVLRVIFEHIDTTPFPNHNPFNPRSFPILQVCREWRQAALSHPRLWCKIEILSDVGKYPDPNVVADYLALSGSRPLEIRLSLLNNAYNLDIMVDHFLQETYRWVSMDIVVGEPQYLRLMDRLGVASNLVTLKMGCGATVEPDSTLEGPTILLPQLCYLELKGNPRNSFVPYFEVPRLEKLHIYPGSFEAKRMHHLISSASLTLEVIDLANVALTMNLCPLANLEALELPSLETFRIECEGGYSIEYIVFLTGCITTDFQLSYRGIPTPLLSQIRSKHCRYLAIDIEIDDFFANVEAEVACFQDESVIRAFFEGFPALVHLQVSAHVYDFSAYKLEDEMIHRVFGQTRPR